MTAGPRLNSRGPFHGESGEGFTLLEPEGKRGISRGDVADPVCFGGLTMNKPVSFEVSLRGADKRGRRPR